MEKGGENHVSRFSKEADLILVITCSVCPTFFFFLFPQNSMDLGGYEKKCSQQQKKKRGKKVKHRQIVLTDFNSGKKKSHISTTINIV